MIKNLKRAIMKIIDSIKNLDNAINNIGKEYSFMANVLKSNNINVGWIPAYQSYFSAGDDV